jgi:hypothetical protein
VPRAFRDLLCRQAMAVGNVNLIELQPRLSSHGSPAAEACSTTSLSCENATLRHTFEELVSFPWCICPHAQAGLPLSTSQRKEAMSMQNIRPPP